MNTYNLLYNNLEDVKIKGIVKSNIAKFRKLGVSTLYDLLYFFPRAYEDRGNHKKIGDILADEFVILKGTVVSAANQYTKSGRTMFRAMLSDDTGIVEIIWFNNKFVKRGIHIGDEIMVYGKVKKTMKFQLVNPEYKKVSENMAEQKQILPIYPSTESLRQQAIRKVMENALTDYGYLLQENLPKEFLKKEKLISRKNAILNIHFPENEEKLKQAKKRFMLEEILLLEMGILQNRFNIDKKNKNIYKLEDNKSLVSKFIKGLSYELTKAQKRVITEIYSELKAGKIVNRLIQGDVGSGKTIVSFIMLLYMVENKYQGVIMAPTEILAMQHYLGIVDEFLNLDVRVELLTGSVWTL